MMYTYVATPPTTSLLLYSVPKNSTFGVKKSAMEHSFNSELQIGNTDWQELPIDVVFIF